MIKTTSASPDSGTEPRLAKSKVQQLSLPLAIIAGAIILSFMIHGSGAEFALDFPLNISSQI